MCRREFLLPELGRAGAPPAAQRDGGTRSFRNARATSAFLNALKPRAPFQVLIMSEESRLGREQLEAEATARDRAVPAELEGTAPSGRREAAEIEAELRSYLTDWRGLLRGEPLQARQMIRTFLIGCLIFTPDEDERGRFYAYEGHVNRMQPIRGTVLARAMVTPAGFGRLWGAAESMGPLAPCH